MKREVLLKDKADKAKRRVEELMVRCWKMTRPICPRMKLHFHVFAQESYFSKVGNIFWVTPFWRGDAFTNAILYHEIFHWGIIPGDLYRMLEDVFGARKLLAEEANWQPIIKRKGLFRKEEDWSKFEYSISEIQYVFNILADYIVNLHIHDNYPIVWDSLWEFLYKEGTFYVKKKALKRDTAYELYIAVYPELVNNLKSYPLKHAKERKKIPEIAKFVRLCRGGKITSMFALKELVKLFHSNIKADGQDQGKKGKGEGKGKGKGQGDMLCPKCQNDTWEITAYKDKKGKWITV